ncbi:NAD(P)-binding domain-containing protein [Nitriliruptor alkaliphilus]|uniref:NAD(P)-binding domain-containing protein n=1 Tax=Nitriliruptor alkaliphilus TaxID=427918 RepID=UPI0006969A10|nr:NAD(P)-binding domain-containing protein [Nitriliruptor alkaliphilus]
MRLTIVGVNHRSAPEGVRERLALDAPEREALLRRVATTFPGCEAMVLATCNRTELVLAEPEGGRAADVWHLVLESRGVSVEPGQEPCGSAEVVREQRSGCDAAHHVLRVAAGLESAVLGDVDVLRQLRRARDEAVTAGTCGKVLHRLVCEAVRTGKRVRTRTELAAGGAGIGSATAALVTAELPSADKVVVVGAGVASRGILAQLRRLGVPDRVVVNRTSARAAKVARAHGASWQPADALGDLVASVDAVVVAAPGWNLDAVWWDGVLARRTAPAELLVVDVCLPHEVDDHPGIDRRDLGDVQAHRDATLAVRAAAIPAAEAIVAGALGDWEAWCAKSAFDAVVAGWYAEAHDHIGRVAATVDDPDVVRAERARVRRVLHDRVTALHSR